MREHLVEYPEITSATGRLLQELSWAGSTINLYRNGGKGYENVLTVEALQGIDFLPRQPFMSEIIRSATGAKSARLALLAEIEQTEVVLLPGNCYLKPSGGHHQLKLSVQPDAFVFSPSVHVLVEAKRIKASSFQPKQLAREFALLLRDAGEKTPLMLLLLGKEPPVAVKGEGRLSVRQSIERHLQEVLEQSDELPFGFDSAIALVDESICWITWQQLRTVLEDQLSSYKSFGESERNAISRTAQSVIDSIAWHS